MSVNINKDYPADPSNYKASESRSIEWIVIHYTGGTASAKNNAIYYQGKNRGASAHYFVGHAAEDAQIYQAIEDHDIAWHIAVLDYWRCDARNANSIGIETACHNDSADQTAASTGWYFDTQTVDRLVELVRVLMDKYGIDADHVVRHYDCTGKLCPAMWVHDEAAWNAFKARLTGDDDMITQDKFNEMMDTYLSDLTTKEPSAWSQAARTWAEGTGLIKGDASGNKQYLSFTSREQMILFLYRFFMLYINKTAGAMMSLEDFKKVFNGIDC